MKKKPAYVVAVAGATGAVGRELLEVLAERSFPVAELRPLASERTEGERVGFAGKNVVVRRLAEGAFAGVDLVFFAAGSAASTAHARGAAAAGAVVIDLSEAFRADPAVPLIVPEVNGAAARAHRGIIACPDAAALSLALALKPLHDAAGVRRVVVTSFEAVSGAGKEASDELAGQTAALLNFRDVECSAFPHQIAFNCIPQVGGFLDSGATAAEAGTADAVRRLLGDPSVQVAATAVRVPVFRCHACSVQVETRSKLSANEARALLARMPGIVVYDDPAKGLYPLQIDTSGKDEVYVGRVREDGTVANGLGLWAVVDNLRKGAALNAVQTAELLLGESADRT